MYIKDLEASTPRPIKDLKEFSRISIKAGETKTVKFSIRLSQLQMINDKGEKVVEPGDFELQIGSSSADIRLKEMFTYK
jgi:beta-glucosidase